MKIRLAYYLDNPGIIPEDFTTQYVSGSVGYGTYDNENPNLSAMNYWEVAEFEYTIEPDRIYHTAIEAGYDTGDGYTLGISDSDRFNWTQLLVLLRESGAADTTNVTIADISGSMHNITLADFRQKMVAAGIYYQQLWANNR